MMNEIEGTIDTVMTDYREISNEEISKERANALKMENTWNDQIKTILPKLEKELESNTRIHQDCKTKLQSISTSDEIFKRMNQLKDHKIKLSNHPNFSKLSKITTNIKQNNEMIETNLDKIDKELNEIQQFDANTVKISPIKDTSNISQFNKPSLSPSRAVRVHRSAGTSPTRIPSLQRLKSETEYLLSAKRRKILHTLDNVSN